MADRQGEDETRTSVESRAMVERALEGESSARAEGEGEEELCANRKKECRATADQELLEVLAKAEEELREHRAKEDLLIKRRPLLFSVKSMQLTQNITTISRQN
ncbi:hypothetical protein H6P81_009304 [Aristolochia fimbriata]|uniref:Uncharacterized protein n=1 Tax=Aristolochia fimbriata TaxID=158543 RepID=A0AAV7EKT0_ARIFI|nr:hypothetical protein H6P81_009304 [Aristolochia fimbriata]